MKKEIIEYHPNGQVSHRIIYNSNGQKQNEQFYDQKGYDHRESDLPDFQYWYQNGKLGRKTYCKHGKYHNICNPSDIRFYDNGKVSRKYYYINNNSYSKLNWQNLIKNIL